MKVMIIIQLIFVTMLLCSGVSSSEGWKGIVPLHSRRADVEQLLGRPSSSCQRLCRYETKREVVLVQYSGEPCTNNEENRWRVPPDTVIELTINSEERPKFSSLNLNLSKFKKTNDPELHGYSSYSNPAIGVDYSVSDDGGVYSITWFPTAKDDEALSCPPLRGSTSKDDTDFNRQSFGVTFQEYKCRLDQFADSIEKVPDAKGYIIAYAGELGPARVARMRLKCIRDYLEKHHRIKRARMVFIDGGYRDDISVELFLVRPGDPTPKPTPTRHPAAVHNVPPRFDPCR